VHTLFGGDHQAAGTEKLFDFDVLHILDHDLDRLSSVPEAHNPLLTDRKPTIGKLAIGIEVRSAAVSRILAVQSEALENVEIDFGKWFINFQFSVPVAALPLPDHREFIT
jgi:hypothetical protein